MIRLDKPEEYKEEILENIDEALKMKNANKKMLGISIYAKTEVMGQFGIIKYSDWLKLEELIREKFGLSIDETDYYIY